MRDKLKRHIARIRSLFTDEFIKTDTILTSGDSVEDLRSQEETIQSVPPPRAQYTTRSGKTFDLVSFVGRGDESYCRIYHIESKKIFEIDTVLFRLIFRMVERRKNNVRVPRQQ